ncbi:hypothetical protein GCM10027448_10580 [Nocardioides dilutus]
MGPPGDAFDGNVSVLVGGNLSVAGSAAGAEGIVLAAGNATFARDEPGPYRVGVTEIGSQVPPHADSDMLVVGGSLTATSSTPLEVAPGLNGDAVVGGLVTDGTVVAQGVGTLDQGVVDALAPYGELLAGLGAKSGAYAGLPVTGTVEITGQAVTLIGDGVSDPQVFAVDGTALGAPGQGPGRSLQLLGVPEGAAAVVNLTGPAVDLDLDSVLGPEGATVDPTVDPYFADLATHLLWNVPSAATVDVGGVGQLPGSLLVGSAPSVTVITGATNGRVYVAGDLVHTGSGSMHSYPFLPDPGMTCGPDLPHLGALTLDVVLKDPANLVDKERFFRGTFACFLDGADVTPGDGTWQFRAQADDRVLSDQVPVGALCFVAEQLEVPPAPGWAWAKPDIAPAKVKIAKRDPQGFTVTNSIQPVKTPPEPEEEPTPTPAPTPTPTPSPEPTSPEPQDPPTTLPDPEPTSPTEEPTVVPEEEPLPSLPPAPDPVVPTSEPDDDPVDTAAAPPAPSDGPGPLTTTAPYTLRGAFVWGPLLLLSVVALRMRYPWRRKRRHSLYY